MFISYFNCNLVDHYVISKNLNENKEFLGLLMLLREDNWILKLSLHCIDWCSIAGGKDWPLDRTNEYVVMGWYLQE